LFWIVEIMKPSCHVLWIGSGVADWVDRTGRRECALESSSIEFWRQ